MNSSILKSGNNSSKTKEIQLVKYYLICTLILSAIQIYFFLHLFYLQKVCIKRAINKFQFTLSKNYERPKAV